MLVVRLKVRLRIAVHMERKSFVSVLDDAAAQHLVPVVQHHRLSGGDGPLGPVKDHLHASVRQRGHGASASVWLYRVLAVTRMVSAGAAPAIQFTRQAVRRLVNRSRLSPSRMVLSRAFFRTT